MIHKEGYITILLVFLFVAALMTTVVYFRLVPIWFEGVVFFSGLLLLLGTVLFFRVPLRFTTYTDRRIYSGADGKVVAIEEVTEDEYFHDRRIQVSVFMSVWNAHVNFSPITGDVVYSKYHPGKHLFAWLPKSALENECSTLVIENEYYGPVLIRQIAGVFARRIVSYPKEGDYIFQGEEYGIIKFGSRVDLFLPLNAKVQVKLNQKVKAAQSVIATLPDPF